MTNFSKRLKELRNQRSLLQKELAAQLNIKRTTIASWESGNRRPELGAIEKLADFFNVSIDYLLGREETLEKQISLSPEREKLIKEFESFDDDEIKEAQQILNYVKSKKTKNQDAATIETIA